MASDDVDMMDVDEPQAAAPTSPPPPPAGVKWVSPPLNLSDMSSAWTEENSNQKRLIEFVRRWPPSRTPFAYGPWILADRGGLNPDATPASIAQLQSEFQGLVTANNVSVETIDKITQANKILVGKWMVFEESSKIDMLWGRMLYHICIERKSGSLKVSTMKEGEKHVICVYVQDYTNLVEVGEMRKMLKTLGVKWKIGFKPDAYTHLNIYKNNPWNIRPSRYSE